MTGASFLTIMFRQTVTGIACGGCDVGMEAGLNHSEKSETRLFESP